MTLLLLSLTFIVYKLIDEYMLVINFTNVSN